MVQEILSHDSGEIKRYVESVKNKSEQERQAEGREKTGVFTGLYAINQLTGCPEGSIFLPVAVFLPGS